MVVETECLRIVNEYCKWGFTCLPCHADTKTPACSWHQFINRDQTAEESEKLFREHTGNIAILCGASSGNLGVIDVEDRDKYHKIRAEFQNLFGPTWTVDTERGGHIYFLTPQPVQGHQYPHLSLEIRGERQYVMAPPSRHPSGSLYEFRTRSPTIPTLVALPFCQLDFIAGAQPRFPQVGAPPELVDLSILDCFDVFNKLGKQRGRYATDSEFDQAVIQTLVNKGASFECILKAFSKANQRTHFSKMLGKGRGARGRDRAEAYLSRSVAKARSMPHTPDHVAAQQRAASFRDYVDHRPWPMKDCSKAVLLAHITRYGKCRREPWNLSVRDCAELARVGASTVTRCNRILVEENYLVVDAISVGEMATAYRFGPRLQQELDAVLDTVEEARAPAGGPRERAKKTASGGARADSHSSTIITHSTSHSSPTSLQLSATIARPERPEEGATVSMCADRKLLKDASNSIGQTATYGVFERVVLGKAAESVWLAVRDVWRTQTEIVEATGLAKGTVSKAVRKLCSHGILMREHKVYIASKDVDFKALGKTMGAINIQDLRRCAHGIDRDGYHEMLVEKRQSR